MFATTIELILCHLIGDYVLQCDFIAKSKGTNWYHLLVHCALYIVPFYIAFGFTWHLLILFLTHIIIDALKARYKKIGYATDQILHYLIVCIYLVGVNVS
jgi:hypothetical protein